MTSEANRLNSTSLQYTVVCGVKKERAAQNAELRPHGGPARFRLVQIFLLVLRLGPSQPGELGGGAKARHRRLASRTLTASKGNAGQGGHIYLDLYPILIRLIPN